MECRKMKRELKECKKKIKKQNSDFCKINEACIKYKMNTNKGFGAFIGAGFSVVIPLLLKYIGLASLFCFPVGAEMYVGFLIFGGLVGGIIGKICTNTEGCVLTSTNNKPEISIKK
uniref:Uncharacterized protein n=1 Tax=Meloidogyne enterolobii TaxID=390850 RepID=A0A6V7XEN4_MELEN|nr:unnamed protein product [Meloidogyne enterolobii]